MIINGKNINVQYKCNSKIMVTMDEPPKKKKNTNQCEMKTFEILATVKIFE